MVRCVALTGGVGGAKLALGLARVLPPEDVLFVVNTGDDFEHLGLTICPDLDTLTYTLAGENDPNKGWGRRDESWQALATLSELGGPDWFQLGDRDLGLHLYRSSRLAAGASLSAVTAEIATALGIRHRLVPMSDDPVRTTVITPDGPLAFQHYFVRERCAPAVSGFRFDGSDRARPQRDWLAALAACSVIVICPSNPYVSVDPMLSLPGVREALRDAPAPVVAVSPIVGGGAIKGPSAKMMRELGVPASAGQIAEHYQGLADGLVLDEADAALHGTLAVPTVVAPTVMVTLADRVALARHTLSFAEALRR